MEPVSDFNELFEAAPGQGGGGLAVAQLERIFGSVIRLVQGGEVSATGDSWLVSAISLFNSAGLLIVVVVSLYTILTVIFDTASDGKAFGQGTDTRYTIMRSLAGAICFIPVSKGFTIAQIGLLWLVVQGSALADKTWSMIAESSISGQNFVQASKIYGTVDAAVASQFADALNALVIGNICAAGLNDINRQVTGVEDAPDVIKYKATSETVVKNQVEHDQWGKPLVRAKLVRNYWTDSSMAYRGSSTICGGVSMEQVTSFNATGTNLFDNIRSVSATKLVSNYVAAINSLSNDAKTIAARVAANENSNTISQMGVAAVRKAQGIYIAGLSADLLAGSGAQDFSNAIEHVQQDAVEKVSEDGWILAPSWQRGISLATAEYRSTLGSLDLNVTPENNASMFLSNNALDGSWIGWRDENPIAANVMAAMEQQQNTWATLAGRVLAEVRGNGAGATGMAGGYGEVDGIMNSLFSTLVDMFAVRDDGGYSDPMIDVTEYGQGLMIGGGSMAALGAAAGYAPIVGAVTGGPAGYAVGEVVSDVGETVLSPLGWGLLLAGFITSSLLPLLPLIYYMSAIVSWLILVVEAIFALPLAVLTLFAPSRGGGLIGQTNRILLTIFGVFLRPFFTVVGFFFGMLLIAVALDLAYLMFREMILMMQAQSSIMRIFGLVGVVLAFLVVSFYTVLLGSGMITQLGDGAMAAIGVAFSNTQGAMDIGESSHRALNVNRAVQPIPLGRLGGGDGGAGRLGSAPGRNGGPGGSPSGGAPGGATFAGSGAMTNVAAMGLRGPGAVRQTLSSSAPDVAKMGEKGGARGQNISTRAKAAGGALTQRFGPLRPSKDKGST